MISIRSVLGLFFPNLQNETIPPLLIFMTALMSCLPEERIPTPQEVIDKGFSIGREGLIIGLE